MAAALRDLAALHDHNQIGIPYGGKAVGDYDTGSSLHNTVHGVLYGLLSARIHIGRGFIQNQDFGIRHKSAGDD